MRVRLGFRKDRSTSEASTPAKGSSPRWRQRLAGRGGFSVVELLLSVIVISVGVVGFASAVGLASLELWFGQRDTNISMVVSDELEELKAIGHDAATSGSRSEGDLQLNWQTIGSDPKKVVLVVDYLAHDGTARADTFVTYLWP